MKKYTKILAVFMVQLMLVLTFSGCSNSDKGFKQLEYISNFLDELSDSEEYKKADDNKKVELMRTHLGKLQDEGKIKDLHYNDYIFHFAYSYDSSLGGVVVKDMHDKCWGKVPSLSQRNNTMKLNIVEDFLDIFKRDNWQFIVGANVDDEVVLEEIKALAREYSNDKTNKIGLSVNTTVKTFTDLDYKDLIYINAHGFYDDEYNIPIIWTQERVTGQTEKNKEYEELKSNNDIGIYFNSNNESYYVIMPNFFQDYYNDSELENSVVLLGICQAFGKNNNENYDLYNSLKNAGAGTVIGFCNSVNQGYASLFFNSIFNSYLSGQTIGEAFDNAKATVGENANEYYKVYSDFAAEKTPAYPILKGNKDIKYRFSDSIDYGEYSFTVKDSVSKKNIEDVSVNIVNVAEKFSTHIYKTDENGICHIKLPAGKYTCSLAHSAYESQELEISIEANTEDKMPVPILLKQKQTAMADFIGMTFGEIVNMYGTDCKIIESFGWIPDSDGEDRIIYYEDKRTPFHFLISVGDHDAPLQPKEIDKIYQTHIYPGYEKVFSLNGKINSDITYSKLKENVSGVRWIDSVIGYIYTYKYDDVFIDFIYSRLPEDNSVADEITVRADADWTPYGDDWDTEKYRNNILYQSVIDKYNEACNKNHSGTTNCYCSWAVCDVDGNGTEELIVQEGEAEQTRVQHIYTVKNGKAIELGKYNAWHLTLYDNVRGDGKLIAVVIDPIGPWTIYDITVNSNSLNQTETKKTNNLPTYSNHIEFAKIYFTLIDEF